MRFSEINSTYAAFAFLQRKADEALKVKPVKEILKDLKVKEAEWSEVYCRLLNLPGKLTNNEVDRLISIHFILLVVPEFIKQLVIRNESVGKIRNSTSLKSTLQFDKKGFEDASN